MLTESARSGVLCYRPAEPGGGVITATSRIVISEFLWEAGLAELEGVAEVVYDHTLYRDPDRLASKAAGAHGLVVRNQTLVDETLLERVPELKVVGRLGNGLDNIDLDAAHRRGVQVVYAPEGNAVPVAEYTIGAAIVLSRRLVAAHLDTAAGGWDRQAFTGGELAEMTVGIIGVGRIGELVARRLKAFGARLLGFDPRLTENDLIVTESGLKLVGWKEIFTRSDLITIHVPLTPETAGLIGRQELALMKPTALLINTARGGVIDETALYEALSTGRIAGAALDVRRREPPGPRGPEPDFARLPNVLLTPHIAGLTREAHVKVTRTVLRDVMRVIQGEAPRFPVFAQPTAYPRPVKWNGG